MSKCSKTIYYKNVIWNLFLNKPVGKYQVVMAYIRALVMIVFQLTNCLISQPKHMNRRNETVLLNIKL